MLKRGLAARVAIVTAAVALACATGGVPDQGARETGRLFLWKVDGPQEAAGSAHLLGSVHFGRPDFRFDPAIQEAFEASDALVMELDPDEATPEQTAALFQDMGRLPEGETLSDLLSPETYQALADALQRGGYPIASLEPFKPWVAIFLLSSLAIQSEGLSREEGVEAHFTQQARGRKEIIGLETPRQQMALFDAMPLALQQEALRGLLREIETPSGATDAIVEAWLRGDTERLAELTLIGSHPDERVRAFHQAIYAERNRNMAGEIARRIDRGGEWFVVIGAGHMVGTEGIPALLEERGYRVRQIEKTH